MSWLAGETKWWLLLAALLGFVLTWLFLLRRVSVTERAGGGSRGTDDDTGSPGGSPGGSLGGKTAAGAAAGAGAVGAGAIGAGAALKDRLGFDNPPPQSSAAEAPSASVGEPEVAADEEPDARTVIRPQRAGELSEADGHSQD